LEVSKIDGCSDTKYFFKIVLPLSKAIIAVITLYYAVGHWNAYFGALIYLNDPSVSLLRNTYY
ncbi:MAG: ABC transporter permease subunit, partial [Ruminiclostridium sp.]|nr:ABC transporter permease subunit [Ruminiclostridium sp.]